MELILVKDVENLGLSGQVVTVAPGYARNYLLPHGLALLANAGNLQMLAKKRAEFEERAKAEKDRAISFKTQLAEVKVILERKVGEKSKLYGAVTAQDIVDALNAQGVTLERKRLRLAEPLKTLGDFDVPVRLHADVMGSIRVSVRAEGAAEAPVEEAAPSATDPAPEA